VSFLTAMFGRPKIPNISMPAPPAPVKNTQLDAQMAQAGRQQGLLATLFGFRSPAGTSGASHTLTGQ